MVLSVEAKHGLDISPVAVSLTGLTNAQVETVGQGSYLVNAVGACTGCHTANPAQFLGGGVPFQLAAYPDGGSAVVYTRNLTSDPATGMGLTEDQFIEALRTGKDFKNSTTSTAQALIVMPWPTFRWMSTGDLKAIYAYLKAIPAVSNSIPNDNKGVFAAAQPVPFSGTYDEGDVSRKLPPETFATGGSVADPGNVQRGLAIQPLADPTTLSTWSAEMQGKFGRGSYLVNAVGDCNSCHTNPDRNYVPGPGYLKISTDRYLSGGRVFGVDPNLAPLLKENRTMSADLTGETHGFFHDGNPTFATFEGILTQGSHIDDADPMPLGFPMPWQQLSQMTLDDLEAVYTYLQNVTPPTGANDKVTQEQAIYCTQDQDCPNSGTCNSDPVLGNECVGTPCNDDTDCAACQTCASGSCVAPDVSSTCLTQGI